MDLLDYLAEETHCEYESDLHYNPKKPSALRKIVERLPLSAFPEAECRGGKGCSHLAAKDCTYQAAHIQQQEKTLS